MKKVMVVIGLLFTLTASSEAAMVVTTCGTLPQVYAVGSTRPMTVDTNGNTCT